MPIRYIIAIVMSCLVTVAGFGIAHALRKSVMAHIRENIHVAAAAGTLPKELVGLDLDKVANEEEGFDVKLPENLFRRLVIADFISVLWFIWVPAVFAISTAVAYFTAGAVRK